MEILVPKDKLDFVCNLVLVSYSEPATNTFFLFSSTVLSSMMYFLLIIMNESFPLGLMLLLAWHIRFQLNFEDTLTLRCNFQSETSYGLKMSLID